MAKTTDADTIVLLDDELFYMQFMMEYLSSKGYVVIPCRTANEAIDMIDSEIYRAVILDLNVPILPPLDEAAKSLGPAYAKYPGLFVARHARNRGYRARQVIIYSVHREPEVTAEVNKLRCTYIRKGRPKEIKEEVLGVLSFDPTDEGG